MDAAKTSAWLLAALLSLHQTACHGNTDPFESPDGDLDADTDVDGDVDGDGDGDGDVEQDAEPDLPEGGGPLTEVVTSIGITDERRCDIDGNGSLDNSVADLGAPASTLAAMYMNTMLASAISSGYRLVYHFPWVDDPSVPSDMDATLLLLEARDGDDPADATDDFAGDEVFLAKPSSLDPCGEPRFYFLHAWLFDGSLETSPGALSLPLDDAELVLQGAVIRSRIEPHGAASEGTLCGYATIGDLGAEPGPEEAGGLSLLEILLAGGEPFGLIGVPGLRVDIDLDADGLETFVLDDHGALVECLDGDLSRIPGRDCWSDETMADAFSLTVDIAAVRAEYGGRAPGWEAAVDGPCTDPPEESLFDPR